jgi:hypothetical protein
MHAACTPARPTHPATRRRAPRSVSWRCVGAHGQVFLGQIGGNHFSAVSDFGEVPTLGPPLSSTTSSTCAGGAAPDPLHVHRFHDSLSAVWRMLAHVGALDASTGRPWYCE